VNDPLDRYLQIISQHESAWKGHGKFAVDLVNQMNPDLIMDLGVNFGFSTFCWAYPKIGEVYGVDSFRGDFHPPTKKAYNVFTNTRDILEKEFGPLKIKLLVNKFKNVSRFWDQKIDILHIDGNHSYESVSNDYNLFSKHVSENGVVLFHDTLSYIDTVGKFFEELDGFKLNKPDYCGLGIHTKSVDTFNKIKNLLIYENSN
jgi:hypothetical protein